MYQENNITNFLDPEVQKVAEREGGILFRMQNETGTGIITQYKIFPGIELFYNDFHMKDAKNVNKIPYANVIEINHCREGRFECTFTNGDCQYIGAGDLSINWLSNETATTIFPLAHYHGISITIDLLEASKTIKKIQNIVGNLDINLEYIAQRFCRKETCFVLRSKDMVQHILAELYCVPPERMAHYLKIKVLELLMYLNDIEIKDFAEEKRYFPKNQVNVIRQLEQYMTADLQRHDTLKELSEKFNISLTTMKSCFKGVYGSSIYSYMKKYRMQQASVLLQETQDSITEIALKMGYNNPGKFSEAFYQVMGILPSDYQKICPNRENSDCLE